MLTACAADDAGSGRPARMAGRDDASQDADATAAADGLDAAAQMRRSEIMAQTDSFPDALAVAERSRIFMPATNAVEGDFVGRIVAAFPDLSIKDARQHWLQLHGATFDGVSGDVWVIACRRDCVSYASWQPVEPTVIGSGALVVGQWVQAHGFIRDGMYLLPAASLARTPAPLSALALQLRLVDSVTKEPIGGADVKITYAADESQTYRTSADGTFVIEQRECQLAVVDARFKSVEQACPTVAGDVTAERLAPL
jgi:hypothetical protein